MKIMKVGCNFLNWERVEYCRVTDNHDGSSMIHFSVSGSLKTVGVSADATTVAKAISYGLNNYYEFDLEQMIKKVEGKIDADFSV